MRKFSAALISERGTFISKRGEIFVVFRNFHERPKIASITENTAIKFEILKNSHQSDQFRFMFAHNASL